MARRARVHTVFKMPPAPFPHAAIEAVAHCLGDAAGGLTHDEITLLFAASGIKDLTPATPDAPPGMWAKKPAKWRRILATIAGHQQRTGNGAALVGFINAAMAPSRHLQDQDRWWRLQGELNKALSTVGLAVNDRGKVATAPKATTLDEIALKAGSMMSELKRRRCHDAVLAYCDVELIRRSNFHAASEAVKGLFDRMRTMTGETSDGGALVDAALSFKNRVPLLALSKLTDESEQSEQRGFANMLKGIYGMYRNPLAHEARARREAHRPVSDDELLGLLTTVSLMHDHLDRCVPTPR